MISRSDRLSPLVLRMVVALRVEPLKLLASTELSIPCIRLKEIVVNVTYVLNGEGEHGISLPVAVAHISREVQQTDRLSSESCVETIEIAGTYPISAGQNVADAEEGDKNVDVCTGYTRC
ncbi:hypothetical protein D918_05073 [Trichuris suis]|nr:hypothetical protein D918_05073 [Trichuris suis]